MPSRSRARRHHLSDVTDVPEEDGNYSTTSVQAKITNAVNTGVNTWLGETKFVFLCQGDGLSGTLTDLTQLHVPEIHQQ